MDKTDLKNGLTQEQVDQRTNDGQTNKNDEKLTRSIPQIISDNLFTLFNFINFVLALLIAYTKSYNNLFFLGPVIANFFIKTYQEIKAKKTVDEISFTTEKEVKTLRDGEYKQIRQSELVIDDIISISRGDQVAADGVVRATKGIELDESSLTGESDSISKNEDDNVYSGSNVVSGQATIQLTAVGKNSYISKLSHEVKQEKRENSVLMDNINKIIRTLSYIILPLGIALFLSSYSNGHNLNQSILGTSAAIIGMIPEGLVLLTSVALTVGAINLSKHDVLTRSLSSIETLARVDILCLDKTGTITTGKLHVTDVKAKNSVSSDSVIQIAKSIVVANDEVNETGQAISEYDADVDTIQSKKSIPFSSEKKYSGFIDKDDNTYLMGALEFMEVEVDEDTNEKIIQSSRDGYRVISVTKNNEFLGVVLIVDELRKDAKSTFSYLMKQGIDLKIISGDNELTVANVAQRAGIKDASRSIDMSQFSDDADFHNIVQDYTVFGRVTPEQKKRLIAAMQDNGNTVGMTGDGVNDVLAMKQSNCSIAIAGGSDAAEATADFVFMNKDFNSMIYTLNEGRRVINNIERVAALYLIKTIYSVILTVIFIFLRTGYPYRPSQLTPINALTVGIPTFLLTMQPDYRKPEGKFMHNVMNISLPAAIGVVMWVLVITFSAKVIPLTYLESSTLCIIAIGAICFSALWQTAKPITNYKLAIFIVLFILSIFVFAFCNKLFYLKNPFTIPYGYYALIIVLSAYPLFQGLREFFNRYVLPKVNWKE